MNNQSEGSKNRSNIEDTNTNPWLLHLIQINDSAFPTGSFAHSFGMETYIQDRDIRNAEDLRDFCDMYLRHNLASTDAIIVQEAYRLAKKRIYKVLSALKTYVTPSSYLPETRKGA